MRDERRETRDGRFFRHHFIHFQPNINILAKGAEHRPSLHQANAPKDMLADYLMYFEKVFTYLATFFNFVGM